MSATAPSFARRRRNRTPQLEEDSDDETTPSLIATGVSSSVAPSTNSSGPTASATTTTTHNNNTTRSTTPVDGEDSPRTSTALTHSNSYTSGSPRNARAEAEARVAAQTATTNISVYLRGGNGGTEEVVVRSDGGGAVNVHIQNNRQQQFDTYEPYDHLPSLSRIPAPQANSTNNTGGGGGGGGGGYTLARPSVPGLPSNVEPLREVDDLPATPAGTAQRSPAQPIFFGVGPSVGPHDAPLTFGVPTTNTGVSEWHTARRAFFKSLDAMQRDLNAATQYLLDVEGQIVADHFATLDDAVKRGEEMCAEIKSLIPTLEIRRDFDSDGPHLAILKWLHLILDSAHLQLRTLCAMTQDRFDEFVKLIAEDETIGTKSWFWRNPVVHWFRKVFSSIGAWLGGREALDNVDVQAFVDDARALCSDFLAASAAWADDKQDRRGPDAKTRTYQESLQNVRSRLESLNASLGLPPPYDVNPDGPAALGSIDDIDLGEGEAGPATPAAGSGSGSARPPLYASVSHGFN